MKNWYQTKEGCSIVHSGQKIEPGQTILLTEDQAKLHNSNTEQLVQVKTAPQKQDEVAVAADWQEFEEQTKETLTNAASKKTSREAGDKASS